MSCARRLAASLAVLAACLFAPSALADSYPSKPIRILVPFGAGGIADLTARTIADKMGESMGQAVVVENRPGAGGVVATQSAARATPDGYTLLLISNGTAVSAGLFKSLPYDTLADLEPVSTLGFFDLAILARADAPFKTLRDALAYAHAHPGKLNVGTINIGSTQNLAAELFKSRAGIDAQIVPFGGTPAVVAALLGGSVDLAVEILGPVRAQIDAGKLKALALMGSRRRESLPGVATVMESGVPDFDVSSWNALAVPAGTPKPIVERLNREIGDALRSPRVAARLADLGVDAQGSTPEKCRQLLASEIKRWSDVISRAGIERQ
ncbi:MAG: Bug family tripartite tricarboxylate transporter substrate binding protein [Usitatibacter sp.]